LNVCLLVDQKSKDPTTAGSLKLKKLEELMINLDPTMLFYKFKETHNDKRDACSKLSQLPMTK
jgi:carboxypeptidase C (cathepsin A)